MLTRTHLAVLRAALRYFDEELVPHGSDAMRPYLDETLESEVTPAEVQLSLRDITLQYAVVNPAEGLQIPVRLYPTVATAMAAISEPSQQLAVVLIPLKS